MTGHGAWLRSASPQADSAAGYVQLVNQQVVDDRLLGASSPRATDIIVRELGENGRAMRVVDPGPVVGRQAGLTLAPGGLHLSLKGVSLRAGERIPLDLHFQHAGDVEVSFVARPVARHLPVHSEAELVR